MQAFTCLHAFEHGRRKQLPQTRVLSALPQQRRAQYGCCPRQITRIFANLGFVLIKGELPFQVICDQVLLELEVRHGLGPLPL